MDLFGGGERFLLFLSIDAWPLFILGAGRECCFFKRKKVLFDDYDDDISILIFDIHGRFTYESCQ